MKNDEFLQAFHREAEYRLGLHRVKTRELMVSPGTFEARGYSKQGKYVEVTWTTDPEDPVLPTAEDWSRL